MIFWGRSPNFIQLTKSSFGWLGCTTSPHHSALYTAMRSPAFFLGSRLRGKTGLRRAPGRLRPIPRTPSARSDALRFLGCPLCAQKPTTRCRRTRTRAASASSAARRARSTRPRAAPARSSSPPGAAAAGTPCSAGNRQRASRVPRRTPPWSAKPFLWQSARADLRPSLSGRAFRGQRALLARRVRVGYAGKRGKGGTARDSRPSRACGPGPCARSGALLLRGRRARL